tara:strand:+ start:3956 stop:4687 length:732 start_codon:yes stop_codon:yes gene_type:complete
MENALITVRSSSNRLPRKCFLSFGNMTVIEHMIKRVKHYKLKPIICTTNESEDVEIVNISRKLGVDYFCGSSINKLMRWRDCCRKFKIKIFHTVDADDLFFCGKEVLRSLSVLKKGYDMVSPSPSAANGGCTVGFSLTSNVVERACDNLHVDTDTEMMWNFIEKLQNIKIKELEDPKESIIKERMTLDYPEDYVMLKNILSKVGNLGSREEIARILKDNPDIARINSFRNKQWKDNQLKKSRI